MFEQEKTTAQEAPNKHYIVVVEPQQGHSASYYTGSGKLPFIFDIEHALPLQLTMASEILDIYKQQYPDTEMNIYSFKREVVLVDKVEPVDYKAIKARKEQLEAELKELKENL